MYRGLRQNEILLAEYKAKIIEAGGNSFDFLDAK